MKFVKTSRQKLRKRLVISKAFAAIPIRKSPEVTDTPRRKVKYGAKLDASVKGKSLRRTLFESALFTAHLNQETAVLEQDRPNFSNFRLNSVTPTLVAQNEPPSKASDVFTFTPADERQKGTQCDVKQRVLKTISRMLHENRILRKQSLNLSQSGFSQKIQSAR